MRSGVRFSSIQTYKLQPTHKNVNASYQQFLKVNLISDTDNEDVSNLLQVSGFNQRPFTLDVRLTVGNDDRSVRKPESISVVTIKHDCSQSSVHDRKPRRSGLCCLAWHG